MRSAEGSEQEAQGRGPSREELASAELGSTESLKQLASTVGNRAFTQLLRSRQQVARDPEGTEESFSDDPLTADGFGPGDGSIRVKPGPVRAGLIRPPKLKTREGYTWDKGRNRDEGSWMQGFLSFFGFRPEMGLTGGTREKYWFNDATHDLTWILDTAVEQAYLDGVTLNRDKARSVAVSLLPPGPAGPSKDRVAVYFSVGVSRATHTEVQSGDRDKPDKPGGQAALQVAWELHPENKSGVELSWVGQVGVGRDSNGGDKYKLQQIMTGPQAAYVFAFLDGSLQLAPLVQLLGGYMRGEHVADRVMRLLPTAQVGAGGQFAYVIPGTKEHLQIGGQAAASFTDPIGGTSTVDYGYQLFLQWKF